jgi:glycerol-3-phosphate acyltransferase PlsX
MITIAVDAMGGDHAPRPEVEGSVLAARELGVRVLLVGQPAAVRAELSKHAPANLPIEVIPASEVITMEDHPVQAFRKKKDSSVHVAARLVREAKADGLVSAGNTGAVMTVAKFLLGTLVQFAVMGEVYYRATFGHRRPRVGLLSVGSEEMKGNELTREVYTRLKKSPVQFVGNVEGGDLFSGDVDVIVCDGFIGNVALKICEGLAVSIFDLLKKSLKSTLVSQVGAVLSQGAFKGLKKTIDYTEYGGAPLLGVRGVCVIGHGRSNANAVKNAIRVAAGLARARSNEKIELELSGAGDLA